MSSTEENVGMKKELIVGSQIGGFFNDDSYSYFLNFKQQGNFPSANLEISVPCCDAFRLGVGPNLAWKIEL